MVHSLLPHPQTPCAAVSGIGVVIESPRHHVLVLRYRLTGDLSRVRLPGERAPARTDGLWRHTCFEAFVRMPGSAAYFEFNFSPTTEWAAYRFSGYRDGMQAADGLMPPCIRTGREGDAYRLDATLDLAGVRDLPAHGAIHLGLTAVVELAEGALSYWSLRHPPGKPDFHKTDGFVLNWNLKETP